jgi:hypothetical protein
MSLSLDDLSLEPVEYDDDYARFNPKKSKKVAVKKSKKSKRDNDLDEYYEYDEPYVTRRLTTKGRKKDWRDLVREGYFRDRAETVGPSGPLGPSGTGPDKHDYRGTPPPAPAWKKETPVARGPDEFVDDLEAIQDFIRAYANRKNADGTPYYKDDSTRAAAMSRDFNETRNVTKNYRDWKNAPWDHDWVGIDTEKKRIEPRHFMPAFRTGGFLREELSPEERKSYF